MTLNNHRGHLWEHHVIGPVSTNCFVFGHPDEAIMVDPGGPEAVKIAKNLLAKEIIVKHILVSHGHFDHLGWAGDVMKIAESAEVYLHEDEKPVYETFLDHMTHFGLQKIELREPDNWLKDNQTLELSGYKFKVLHTPGHSPGSATFLLQQKDLKKSVDMNLGQIFFQDTAFVGDCIFQGSIGRVDLPFANPQEMKKSLHRLIDELSAQTHLYPGHGPDTVMVNELESNPFLVAIQNNQDFF